MKPSIGRIVHYFPNADLGPFPAIVTAVNGPESVNLAVFTDGTNGALDRRNDFAQYETDRGMAWRTSVHRRTEARPVGWDWPVLGPG